jgi:collagenase-like PrtC family protease
MKYLVACNWDFELIDRIDYPEVATIFGGLPDTLISSGRPTQNIAQISENDTREYIKRVHDKKWRFDFNINASCTANMELTPKGFKATMRYLERLCDLGVDAVTIMNPNLIGLVKKNFPKLRVNLSTFQKVSDVAEARRFEDLGVDMLMLSEHINRDFKALAAIRKAVDCELTLVANVGCIYNCPNMHAHANSIAHAGAKGAASLFAESFQLFCFGKRLEGPEEIMKIRWIRPEDVALYEEVGIDMLKIIDRSNFTDVLAERVKAYCERSYDGNLIGLLGQMLDPKRSVTRGKELVVKRMLTKPGLGSLRHGKGARAFRGLMDTSLHELLYVDNKAIPQDFLESFMGRDCRTSDCRQCGNCKKVADQVVQVLDPERLSETLARAQQGLAGIRDGSTLLIRICSKKIRTFSFFIRSNRACTVAEIGSPSVLSSPSVCPRSGRQRTKPPPANG